MHYFHLKSYSYENNSFKYIQKSPSKILLYKYIWISTCVYKHNFKVNSNKRAILTIVKRYEFHNGQRFILYFMNLYKLHTFLFFCLYHYSIFINIILLYYAFHVFFFDDVLQFKFYFNIIFSIGMYIIYLLDLKV